MSRFFLWWRMVERKSSLPLVFSAEWLLSSLKYKFDIVISVFLSLDQNLMKPKKGSCWLFTSYIYFYKNQKYRRLEMEKKLFSVILFQKFLVFPIWPFQKMLNISSENSFHSPAFSFVCTLMHGRAEWVLVRHAFQQERVE